jgi:DNA modification methylase
MGQIGAPSTIESVAIGQLVPYTDNPRKHEPKNIAKLVASIKEYGWTQPVLITQNGEVIAGHGRILAARELKMAVVPCIRLTDMSDAQVRAYRIADNRLGLDSDWDLDLLMRELGKLNAEQPLQINIDSIGFDPKELQKILAADEVANGQKSEEFSGGERDPYTGTNPDIPGFTSGVSQYGMVWELDSHRLACGDCTDPVVVTQLLGGASQSINLMVTDPPYGVNYDVNWRSLSRLNVVAGRESDSLHKTNGEETVRNCPSVNENNANSPAGGSPTYPRDNIIGDNCPDWRGALSYFHGNIIYLWHGGLVSGVAADVLNVLGFEIRAQIIWRKGGIIINRGAYNWAHEPCYYAVRKGQNACWRGPDNASTIWDVNTPHQSNNKDLDGDVVGHPNQKSVEIFRRPIIYHTQKGDAVFDPFLGSGTTLIAAETAGRVCFGIELSPKYVDTSVLRWQRFTSKEAICQGKTFKQWQSAAISEGR